MPSPMNNEEYQELQHVDSRVARLEQAIGTLSEQVTSIARAVNEPFPIWQVISSIGGMALIIGAMFSFAVNPLFIDTERNRKGIEAVVETKANQDALMDTRDWVRRISERERLWENSSRERLSRLETKLEMILNEQRQTN